MNTVMGVLGLLFALTLAMIACGFVFTAAPTPEIRLYVQQQIAGAFFGCLAIVMLLAAIALLFQR